MCCLTPSRRHELSLIAPVAKQAAKVRERHETPRVASLADLFRGRSQLLVYHFMFGPDYTAGCPSCSAIADGFNGFVIHVANHDVMLWAVSRAPIAKLKAYKRRMVVDVSLGVLIQQRLQLRLQRLVHRRATARGRH